MGRCEGRRKLAPPRRELPARRPKALRDPFAVEWIDDREDYAEERINLLGMGESVILHVTYTERGEQNRIISARRATRHEQDHYYRENAP